MIETYNEQKHIKTLELDKVLNLLSLCCSMDETKEKAKEIMPKNNFHEVNELLKETEDAFLLSARFSAPTFGKVTNVISLLSRAEMGGVLNMHELLKIGELLRVSRTVKSWKETNAENFNTSLDKYFNKVTPNKYFEEKIFSYIKSEDEMSDNASETLYNIRKKIRKASLAVREKLEKTIKGSAAKYLQDSIITQREGRFVVPVKAENKSAVPGLVHDTSSSGATLFVEPMAVVELNNDIRVLKSKEKEEIERILYELSADAAVFANSAKISYNALLSLDLIFAKAALGYKMKATVPKINDIGKIKLNKARHPLIDQKSVVPISLELGYDYTMLLITGPNTGGKTVTLKTIGLLCLMTSCGLLIPAEDGSEIAVFNKIFADIGDEQSIEQSLSTFSSHIKNIINILDLCDKNSLILFDELCAGTDPVEGAALAESILNRCMEKNSTVAATTHYAELKTFALEKPKAQNACCEFDVETLKPTYRLLIGVPGRSNAFEISKKLGLDVNIVEKAKELISRENVRFDNVISQLEKAHTDARKEKETAEALKIKMEKAQKLSEEKLKEVTNEKEKILENARQKTEDTIDYAKSEANRLLNELEEIKKKITKENASDSIIKAKTLINQKIKNIEKTNTGDEIEDSEYENYTLPRALKPGDNLRVKGFSKLGVLEKQNGNKLQIVLGNIKTTVDIKDVMLFEEKPKEKRTRTISGIKSKAEMKTVRELDIRGLSVDEGIIEVERFIDNCVLSGAENVTVIHGKGTGVLREAVRKHLKTLKQVKSIRPGIYGEGENGVTVVTLK